MDYEIDCGMDYSEIAYDEEHLTTDGVQDVAEVPATGIVGGAKELVDGVKTGAKNVADIVQQTVEDNKGTRDSIDAGYGKVQDLEDAYADFLLERLKETPPDDEHFQMYQQEYKDSVARSRNDCREKVGFHMELDKRTKEVLWGGLLVLMAACGIKHLPKLR